VAPRWSATDDDLIRQHYPCGGIFACCAVLSQRTCGAIEQRAQHLKVRRSDLKPWTVPEIAHLKVSYPGKGLRGGNELLERHSRAAILKMASRLKLSRKRKVAI